MRLKNINNPMTLIATFTGMVEIVLIYTIRLVNAEFQYILVWFVIGLPTLLILLFFTILIFKPKVLYSPKDFKDEQNFLLMMGITERKTRNKRLVK